MIIAHTNTTKTSRRPQPDGPIVVELMRTLLNLLIINTILSHVYYPHETFDNVAAPNSLVGFPRILLASANVECESDYDCDAGKLCHENKCICPRENPIEDQNRCLIQALINEQCSKTEQCLGNSRCLEGICSCGNEDVSIPNPSTRIYYCHPKRRLNEQCVLDPQCPINSFCSKYGCLCQNGYGEGTVLNESGTETKECLPKTCTNSSSCESEYHQCEENKCKCLATHFDPETAKCYKFGSKGGKPLDELLSQENETSSSADNIDNSIHSILKDLIGSGDKIWLVLIILITLSILLLVLIFIIVRKFYIAYCWTAHKKEYEPNPKNAPKNGYFNKNSINNKSFRQKNGETDEDEDDTVAADRSSLVTSPLSAHDNKQKDRTFAFMGSSNYVKVNMKDSNRERSSTGHQSPPINQHHHQAAMSPLASSTSTPV